jgi:hypothetical protein
VKEMVSSFPVPTRGVRAMMSPAIISMATCRWGVVEVKSGERCRTLRTRLFLLNFGERDGDAPGGLAPF